MICNKCGAQLSEDAYFCEKCGAPIARPPTSARPLPPPPPPRLVQMPPPRSRLGRNVAIGVGVAILVVVVIGLLIAAIVVVPQAIKKGPHVEITDFNVKNVSLFGDTQQVSFVLVNSGDVNAYAFVQVGQGTTVLYQSNYFVTAGGTHPVSNTLSVDPLGSGIWAKIVSVQAA